MINYDFNHWIPETGLYRVCGILNHPYTCMDSLINCTCTFMVYYFKRMTRKNKLF